MRTERSDFLKHQISTTYNVGDKFHKFATQLITVAMANPSLHGIQVKLSSGYQIFVSNHRTMFARLSHCFVESNVFDKI